MDIDPAILNPPYYDEMILDRDSHGIAPLLPFYDALVVCEDAETYSQENPHLVLYYSPTCPYCKKVENYLKKEKKWEAFPKKNIANQEARNELIQKGGKKQVPCLLINGKAMYESKDILKWLKNNQDKY